MRYIITIILAVITFIGQAQTPTQQFNGNLYQYNFGHYVKGSQFVPRDTISWVGSMGDSGRIAYKNGKFWARDIAGWKEINTGINTQQYLKAIRVDSISNLSFISDSLVFVMDTMRGGVVSVDVYRLC